ncbi:hypothetical protein [Zobellia laminariae]|uniref:hypothetical protein n=1 Tax=Zobellia laminariae TaxID=248906 RepID=UPI00405669D3
MMKKILQFICCFTVIVVLNQDVLGQTSSGYLDMSTYLKLADSDIIYPSSEQIEMLKKVLPKEAFQPASKISDRGYWDAIANSESGHYYLVKANGLLNTKPEMPTTDSIYRLANKEGKLTITYTPL